MDKPAREKSEIQKLVERLDAALAGLEDDVGELEQITATITGEAPPPREHRIFNPFTRPIEGFGPAMHSLVERAERVRARAAKVTAEQKKQF